MRIHPSSTSQSSGFPLVEQLEDRRFLSTGAVYAMTNAADGNAVAVFNRAKNGTLTDAGMVSTGGLGAGDGSDTEGLQSQGALVFGGHHHFLYAANAGSGDISVLAVEKTGLKLVQKIASGGDHPISITVHGNVLYVLNYDRLASPTDTGNITGFRIKNGMLTPLAGSTRAFSTAGTNPGQVAFTRDGRTLVVTEKATDQILTYAVDGHGVAAAPIARASGGDFPFDIAFGPGRVIVEADDFQDNVGQGAASSYLLSKDGVLTLVSGAVANHQDGSCWVVTSKNHRFAFVVNTNNAAISAYHISSAGVLTLVNSTGLSATSGGVKPRDAALSNDGHFLYVLNSASGTVSAFKVGKDGSLTLLGTIGALPGPGSNGLAAT